VQEWASLLSSLLGEDVRIAPSNISSTRLVVVPKASPLKPPGNTTYHRNSKFNYVK
jgi:hypothetical protein